ncbi:hypothetical protein BJ912DRAFT_1054516 [Pholiota molesta]|nr:hypothetical protein BJ912DRAFT_1054516 [Pholiota molesta]
MRTVIDGCLLPCPYKREFRNGRHHTWRYPENTRGFFYYHASTDGPGFDAGVRFRICDSAGAFAHGRDLLYPRGDVWGPKILELVKHKLYNGFLAFARAENLIDEALVNDINRLDIAKTMRTHNYSLSDPFLLNLAHSIERLTFITRAKLVRLNFPAELFHVRTGPSRSSPLTGLIKVQFELSDLPEHKELGPTLVVRVLDVVEPIYLDPLYHGNTMPPVPIAGKLLHRNTYGRKTRAVHIPLKDQPMADDLLELMKAAWP